MIASPFVYHRARSVQHVLDLLAEHGDEAKVIAGGQSLVSMMKLRLTSPAVLIDVNDLAELRRVHAPDEGDALTIGALVTHAEIAADATIAARLPALGDAAGVIGDPQVRNRGTLGGATAHGDPSADYPAVLLALDARIALQSTDGTRSVSADDFFLGMFETALAAGELLTAIAFDAAPLSAYEKLEHPASGYPVAGVAVRLTLDGRRIASARIGMTGLADCAVRAPGVEDALAGLAIDDEAGIARACRGAAADVDIAGDNHAPADYRRAMADVLAERVVAHALRRRKGP